MATNNYSFTVITVPAKFCSWIKPILSMQDRMVARGVFMLCSATFCPPAPISPAVSGVPNAQCRAYTRLHYVTITV